MERLDAKVLFLQQVGPEGMDQYAQNGGAAGGQSGFGGFHGGEADINDIFNHFFRGGGHGFAPRRGADLQVGGSGRGIDPTALILPSGADSLVYSEERAVSPPKRHKCCYAYTNECIRACESMTSAWDLGYVSVWVCVSCYLKQNHEQKPVSSSLRWFACMRGIMCIIEFPSKVSDRSVNSQSNIKRIQLNRTPHGSRG